MRDSIEDKRAFRAITLISSAKIPNPICLIINSLLVSNLRDRKPRAMRIDKYIANPTNLDSTKICANYLSNTKGTDPPGAPSFLPNGLFRNRLSNILLNTSILLETIAVPTSPTN